MYQALNTLQSVYKIGKTMTNRHRFGDVPKTTLVLEPHLFPRLTLEVTPLLLLCTHSLMRDPSSSCRVVLFEVELFTKINC